MSTNQTPQDLGEQPSVDGSVWANTVLQRLGALLTGMANQFVKCIQFVIPISGSPISTEKDGFIVQGVMQDPSDYAKGILHDGCAIDGRMTIPKGNMTGRVWGLYGCPSVEAGGDGLAINEFCVVNDGSDQPVLDNIDSKYAVYASSAGKNPLTAAFYAIAGKYHHGFVMRTDAFPADTDHFIVLYFEGTNTPAFRIHPKTGMITHIAGRETEIAQVKTADGLTRDVIALK